MIESLIEPVLLVPFICLMAMLLLIGFMGINLGSLRRENTKLHTDLMQERVRLEGSNVQLGKLEAENTALVERGERLFERVSLLEKQLIEVELVLDKERESHESRLALLREAEVELKDAFKSLSAEILKSNNTAFLELANASFGKMREGASGDLKLREEAISNLVQPMHEGLKQFDQRIQEMEKKRIAQMASVSEMVQSLSEANTLTRIETKKLMSSLRAPDARGVWGEMQLRRTIELAGMIAHCDFVEQKRIGDESENLRPDVIVKLPNGREVVIDSKVPLSAYLDGNETEDPEQKELFFVQHAKQIREHLKRLSQKAYHEHLNDSPEFVVLFLPGEAFYSIALEKDPSLIEYGVDKKVIIATPTTLIALLKAIAYGWKSQEIVEKADEIQQAGYDLYESVLKMLEHLGNVRKSLNHTVVSFNQTIRSTDKRLLPRVKKFRDLSAGTEREIPVLKEISETAESTDIEKANDGGKSRI